MSTTEPTETAVVEEDEEREYEVIATTTVTAKFTVYATSEDDAREQVEHATPIGDHAFDFYVDVPGADADADSWDVASVEARA